MVKHNIHAVDLFCGVGGITYGLKQAGINVDVGIDNNEKCRYAYETNNNVEFVQADIRDIDGSSLCKNSRVHTLNLLVGCAPCQPFSIKFKHDPKLHNKYGLLLEFQRIISESSFDIIVSENVPGLAKNQIFKDFIQTLKDSGYHVYYEIVNCLDYGIPQTRKRMIMIASKLGRVDGLPKTHSLTGDYGLERYETVRDTIGFLNDIDVGDPDYPMHKSINLSDINLKRIRQSKPGGSYLDWDNELWRPRHKKGEGGFSTYYARMEWDKPCGTITTEYHNFGAGRYGHPEKDRALSILEGLLLQTFPIDYKFTETNSVNIMETAKHIGNAVPVKLAKYIGEHLLNHINYYKR